MLESQKYQHRSIDWLKWIAIIAMFIDHLRFIPEWNSPWYYIIGRASYPIFALLCGWNLIMYSKNPRLFTKRVFLLGSILMLIAPLTIIGPLPLNPILALFIGLAISLLVQKLPPTKKIGNILSLSLTLITLLLVWVSQHIPLDIIISYGWFGPSLVVATAIYALGIRAKKQILYQTMDIFCIASLAWNLNPTPMVQIIGVAWTLLTIYLLNKDILCKCPLPNNYWLYLSFPFSIILPGIIAWLVK
jgi:hypothetical protein